MGRRFGGAESPIESQGLIKALVKDAASIFEVVVVVSAERHRRDVLLVLVMFGVFLDGEVDEGIAEVRKDNVLIGNRELKSDGFGTGVERTDPLVSKYRRVFVLLRPPVDQQQLHATVTT